MLSVRHEWQFETRFAISPGAIIDNVVTDLSLSTREGQ